MRPDKVTQKLNEAMLQAQGIAEQYNNATVDPEHLLAGVSCARKAAWCRPC